RRVQQDLPRVRAAVDGAVEQVVVELTVYRRGRSEDLGDRLVPLNRDVGVSLVEQVVFSREQRELKRPELGRRRKEMIVGGIDPIDDADSIRAKVSWID